MTEREGTGLDIYLKGWSGSEERSVEELRSQKPHSAIDRSIHLWILGVASAAFCVCVQAAGLVLASFQQEEQNRPVDQLQNRYQGIWQILLTTVREEEGVPAAGSRQPAGRERKDRIERVTTTSAWNTQAGPSRLGRKAALDRILMGVALFNFPGSNVFVRATLAHRVAEHLYRSLYDSSFHCLSF